MTEAEWLAATDPTPMLEFLRGTASDRKLRLFSVACCCRIGDLLIDERSRSTLRVVERFAEGLASNRDLEEARANASAVEDEQFEAAYPGSLDQPDSWSFEVCCDASSAASAAERAASDHPIGMSAEAYRAKQLPGTPFPPGCYSVYQYAQEARAHSVDPLRYERVRWDDSPERASAKRVEATSQTRLAQDIFGNPFRHIDVEPVWLTSTVVALAEGIYQDRAFDRLPILADALQDAGCDNDDVLNHCRSDGPHVRGCWVVDLLTRRK